MSEEESNAIPEEEEWKFEESSDITEEEEPCEFEEGNLTGEEEWELKETETAETEESGSPSSSSTPSHMPAADLSPPGTSMSSSPGEVACFEATPITEASVQSSSLLPSRRKTRFRPRIKRRATGYVSASKLDALLKDVPENTSNDSALLEHNPAETTTSAIPCASTDREMISPPPETAENTTTSDSTISFDSNAAESTTSDSTVSIDSNADSEMLSSPSETAENTTSDSTISIDSNAAENTTCSDSTISIDSNADREITSPLPEAAENTTNDSTVSSVSTASDQEMTTSPESSENDTPDAETADSATDPQVAAKTEEMPTFEQLSKKEYKLLCEKVEYYQKEAKDLEFRLVDSLRAQEKLHKTLQELKDENDRLRREKDTLIQLVGRLTEMSKRHRPAPE